MRALTKVQFWKAFLQRCGLVLMPAAGSAYVILDCNAIMRATVTGQHSMVQNVCPREGATPRSR
jgi:hypothetical protein